MNFENYFDILYKRLWKFSIWRYVRIGHQCMDGEIVILLTACINPNGMSFTKLQDSKIRRLQYEQALDFYLKKTNLKIVFVENTDTYIGDKYDCYIHQGRLEFITFMGNDYSRELGKGYGEAIILKYAVEHSILLGKAESIVKITGRLCVLNICQLVNLFCVKNTVYANHWNYNGKFWCNSQFFIAPVSFLRNYFLLDISKLNDSKGDYFECLLYNKIQEWKRKTGKYHEFYLPINIIGMSGTTGKVFKKKRLRYIRTMIRFLMHLMGIYNIYLIFFITALMH